LVADADWSGGNGDDIAVRRSDSGMLQSEFGRLVGHAVLGMLVAHEALFLHGSNQLAIDIQGSGRIMAQSAGQSQNGQSHGCTSQVEVKAGILSQLRSAGLSLCPNGFAIRAGS